MDGAIAHEIPRKYTTAESIRFYTGEYFAGIFFLSALLSFTFLVPLAIARPGKMIFAMIDKSLKKMLDIFGALIGLILSFPFFVILPIIIKLESRGPVFYTQERVGVNRRRGRRRNFKAEMTSERRGSDCRKADLFGRPFNVIKFRTMVQDAEVKTGPVWATKNDSRITRVGKILRKTRLDEIPQLINVLKGDMSLVGPRPERHVFVKDLSTKVPHYAVRLRVKPGITGLAQVTGEYDSSVDSVNQKVKTDITYIRNWSILSDVKILMKTVVVVITGKGAC
jgi:lipopolysaccharide/colanic/teichoic acid biosynthesis glycosyltransferase